MPPIKLFLSIGHLAHVKDHLLMLCPPINSEQVRSSVSSGKDHRHAMLVGGDDLFVFNRAVRLNDRLAGC
jgi:hypothetical protein